MNSNNKNKHLSSIPKTFLKIHFSVQGMLHHDSNASYKDCFRHTSVLFNEKYGKKKGNLKTEYNSQ